MGSDGARLIALAIDPEVRPADDLLARRILDAALDLAAASGLRGLTMDDVAARAGVGRMTVYRRFGSKAALIDALAVRECRRCLARLAEAVQATENPTERLSELFLATLSLIREHPLLARLASFEPQALLRELTRDDSAVFRLVRSFLVALIESEQRAGRLSPADPELLAELAVRLGASFVLMPETALPVADAPATREILARLLAPFTGS